MKFKISILFLISIFSFSSNAQIDGDNIFENDQVITINLTFSDPNYWDTLEANYATSTYMIANLVITDSTGTTSIDSVGVRLKGNSSYNHPNNKKSFKIDFNKYVSGQNYDGLKKLNFGNCFKDPSFMREKVLFDLCQDAGVPAPRVNYANVYMNGTLKGFYVVVEQIDDQFLDWRILDDNGNLFKAGSNFGAGPQGGGEAADLKYYGSSRTDYGERYELKTNESINDWSDLIDFVDFIDNSNSIDFQNNLATRIEFGEYLRSAAIDNLFSSLDSYTGSARNYYIYHNESTDKWEWIKWDGNESFGSYGAGGPGGSLNMITLALDYHDNDRPLLENIFNNPTLYDRYLSEMCYVTENFFNSTYIDAKIDKLESLIQSSVYSDVNKMYSDADFNTNISSDIVTTGGPGPGGGSSTIYGLKSFVQQRLSYVESQLDCSVYNDIKEVSVNNLDMYPNPANDVVTLKWTMNDFSTLYIYNSLGELVFSENVENINQTTLDISNFEKGFYEVLMFGYELQSKKLIVN